MEGKRIGSEGASAGGENRGTNPHSHSLYQPGNARGPHSFQPGSLIRAGPFSPFTIRHQTPVTSHHTDGHTLDRNLDSLDLLSLIGATACVRPTTTRDYVRTNYHWLALGSEGGKERTERG